MFNKFQTKHLLVAFLVLAVIVGITSISNKSGNSKRQRTFKSELVDADTSKLTQLVIYPKGGGEVVTLSKKDDAWWVSSEEGEFPADANQAKSLLGTLLDIKAKHLAATDKSRWEEYEVTDSAAVRVQAFIGKKVVSELYLGKFNYQQKPAANPWERPTNVLTTYVRKAGEKEVFAVEGMLSMTFSRSANDFRDKTVLSVSSQDLAQISIDSAGAKYSLVKEGGKWMFNGIMADSASVVEFVNGLGNVSHSTFAKVEDKANDVPEYSITLNGDNFEAPVKIEAFNSTDGQFVVHSTQNKYSYFKSDLSGLITKLFPAQSKFLQSTTEE